MSLSYEKNKKHIYAYREKNLTKIMEWDRNYQRQHYQENRDRILAQKKEYYQRKKAEKQNLMEAGNNLKVNDVNKATKPVGVRMEKKTCDPNQTYMLFKELPFYINIIRREV
jgi:hypothetical protein